MKRCLFTILAALSVLLCLPSVGLWLRALYVLDVITWANDDSAWRFASTAATLHLGQAAPLMRSSGLRCTSSRASKERCPECGQPVISAPHNGKAMV